MLSKRVVCPPSAPRANANPFHKTHKLLRQLEDDHLRCVKCGDLFRAIFTLNPCDHKFCGKCTNYVRDTGRCFICDVKITEHDISPDTFLMQLVQRIQKFKRVVEKYENM